MENSKSKVIYICNQGYGQKAVKISINLDPSVKVVTLNSDDQHEKLNAPSCSER